ncbi:uncharacterized protein LAESUDRAFT_726977 [Laetiporus sulphureus 93-53]|uniref:Cupredoxin n=1 Tax=Laetiporus sulphureus 93-53 TaxID=1314785 RepID=A0A165DPL5_9APHY|nr:uncharacterized protein LAESUDRAFT_726977 [Laetiporus sulphureus 93-53]KZT05344.1 hypothetical protein LAESUDRAFT_726977 [Laetiporus sulphureus 93-53]
MYALSLAVSALAASVVSATQWNITVGLNTTTNASLVFQPGEVHAVIGDTVVFNFTTGNHTATQSTFASPCIVANEVNSTINGFNSGFRDAGNETAITQLTVPITSNDSIWFFDYNTCGEGGVGVINANDSSTQTLLGFIRNAKRLNGTATSSSASSSATSTGGASSGSSGSKSGSGSSSSSSSTATTSSSAADRNIVVGGLSVIPLVLAALAL